MSTKCIIYYLVTIIFRYIRTVATDLAMQPDLPPAFSFSAALVSLLPVVVSIRAERSRLTHMRVWILHLFFWMFSGIFQLLPGNQQNLCIHPAVWQNNKQAIC